MLAARALHWKAHQVGAERALEVAGPNRELCLRVVVLHPRRRQLPRLLFVFDRKLYISAVMNFKLIPRGCAMAVGTSEFELLTVDCEVFVPGLVIDVEAAVEAAMALRFVLVNLEDRSLLQASLLCVLAGHFKMDVHFPDVLVLVDVLDDWLFLAAVGARVVLFDPVVDAVTAEQVQAARAAYFWFIGNEADLEANLARERVEIAFLSTGCPNGIHYNFNLFQVLYLFCSRVNCGTWLRNSYFFIHIILLLIKNCLIFE